MAVSRAQDPCMVYLPTCGWFKIFNVHGDRTSSHQTEYHVGLGDIRKKGTYSDCWPSTLPFLHRNRSSDRGLIARQTLNAIALRGTNTQRTRASHIHGTCAKYIYIYTPTTMQVILVSISTYMGREVGPLSPASNSWQVNSSPPSYHPLAHFPPSRPLDLLFSFSLFWFHLFCSSILEEGRLQNG